MKKNLLIQIDCHQRTCGFCNYNVAIAYNSSLCILYDEVLERTEKKQWRRLAKCIFAEVKNGVEKA